MPRYVGKNMQVKFKNAEINGVHRVRWGDAAEPWDMTGCDSGGRLQQAPGLLDGNGEILGHWDDLNSAMHSSDGTTYPALYAGAFLTGADVLDFFILRDDPNSQWSWNVMIQEVECEDDVHGGCDFTIRFHINQVVKMPMTGL